MEDSMTARMTPLQPRLQSPDSLLPDLRTGIQALVGTVCKSGLPRSTVELVHLRVSQVNGCAPCIDSGWRTAKKSGESDERLFNVAAWRHAPYYSDAERAALALAEATTRLADREEPVPDAIWNDAARHFEEKPLMALVTWIALTNFFNRLNAATAQVAAGAQWG
jgi:AhpD family alkylhydroperoxidase